MITCPYPNQKTQCLSNLLKNPSSLFITISSNFKAIQKMTSLRSGIKLGLMKKLSAYLFLILFSFSVPSFADDIRDFEIEGVTIGDSLLDYMSEEEIKENVGFVYTDKKFTLTVYKKSSELYDMGIGIEYKSNDETYKIYGVQGRVNFENDIEGCYKKQDEIEKDISSMFQKSKIKKMGFYISPLPRFIK